MKKRLISLLLAAGIAITGCSAGAGTGTGGTKAADAAVASGDSKAAYPDGDLRIIVPFATGGALDVQVRTVAKYLAEDMGVNVIVENKKGAGGIVGISDYLKEKPNTSTIVLMDAFLLTGTPLTTKVEYTVEDYTPIIDLKTIPYVLYTCPEKSGIHNFEELKHAGSVKFGSDGPGTFLFTGTSALLGKLGVTGTTVTHDGATAGIANMISGVTDVMLSTTMDKATQGYVQEGQLIPLVYLGSEDYPADEIFTEGIPCAKSLGVDMDYYGSYYFAIRQGTDQAIVDQLYDAFNKVYQNEAFLKEAKELGILCEGKNSAELTEFVKEASETAKQYIAQ